MLTKAALGLAIGLASVSGTLAATKTHSNAPSQIHAAGQNVYNPAGAYVGSDPDLKVRFEMYRDWGRGR